eukprot:UN00669
MNSEVHYNMKHLRYLIRMLENVTPEERKEWFLNIRQCRRRPIIDLQTTSLGLLLFNLNNNNNNNNQNNKILLNQQQQQQQQLSLITSGHNYIDLLKLLQQHAYITRLRYEIDKKKWLLLDAFRIINSLKTGWISKEELYGALYYFKIPHINPTICRQLYNLLDIDQDGKVSFKDFLLALQKPQEDLYHLISNSIYYTNTLLSSSSTTTSQQQQQHNNNNNNNKDKNKSSSSSLTSNLIDKGIFISTLQYGPSEVDSGCDDILTAINKNKDPITCMHNIWYHQTGILLNQQQQQQQQQKETEQNNDNNDDTFLLSNNNDNNDNDNTNVIIIKPRKLEDEKDTTLSPEEFKRKLFNAAKKIKISLKSVSSSSSCELIWTSKGTASRNKLSIWSPILSKNGNTQATISLGHFPSNSYNIPNKAYVLQLTDTTSWIGMFRSEDLYMVLTTLCPH